MDAAAVVSFLWRDVACVLFWENTSYGSLFHEQLWRRGRFTKLALSKDQPYPDYALGCPLPVYIRLYLAIDANPCQQLYWAHQFCTSDFYGDFYSMVPEMVSGKGCRHEEMSRLPDGGTKLLQNDSSQQKPSGTLTFA